MNLLYLKASDLLLETESSDTNSTQKDLYLSTSNLKLEHDASNNKFFENNIEMLRQTNNDDGVNLFDNNDFKKRIKVEVSNFINQSFDNIVVLAGAGSSVVVDESGIFPNYGKTVAMIAEDIYNQLNVDEELWSLQELIDICEYTVPAVNIDVFNKEFNLKDFLSRLLIYENSLINQGTEEYKKFEATKEKIFEIIKKDAPSSINPNYGKTVAMIAENIYNQLNEDEELYDLQQLVNICKYTVPAIETERFNKKFNLEDFLSNLLIYESVFIKEGTDGFGVSEDDKKFITTKEKIFEIIKENTTYDFNHELMNHDTFLKILSTKVKTPYKLNIVTTNYDTLFENAGEHLGFTFIDGFTFSVNPFFDSDMFDWNLVKEVSNIKTRELEYKSNVVNLLKIHGSLTWERTTEHGKIYRKHSANKPILIFPSSNKYAQSYEEPYFELFTKFQELLKKPNTLLITTGFSFADNHITKMITGAIKNNKNLGVLVTDHYIQQEHDNWKSLEKLMKNHFRIMFLKATLNGELCDFLGGTHDY